MNNSVTKGIKVDVNATDSPLRASYLVNRFTVSSTALIELITKENSSYNTQELFLESTAADGCTWPGCGGS